MFLWKRSRSTQTAASTSAIPVTIRPCVGRRDERGGPSSSYLSLSGAAVFLSSPVEPGTAVTFTVHSSLGRVIMIRGKVRRVESHDGDWLTGCEFDRQLSTSELAELT